MKSTDFFAPPKSALRTAGSSKPQPVRGVIMGLTLYVVGSFALVNAFLLLAQQAGSRGAPVNAGFALVLTSALDPATVLGAVASLLVLAASFAAGYVCAAVARVDSLIAPTVVATVAVSLELFFGPGAQSTGVWLGLSLLTFAMTLAGGFAWVRQERRGLVLK